MNDKEIVEIVDTNGNSTMVELVTYLISDDRLKQYIVYTKGEIKPITAELSQIYRWINPRPEY